MAFDSGGLPGLAWGVLGVIRHEMSPALANHRSATQMNQSTDDVLVYCWLKVSRGRIKKCRIRSLIMDLDEGEDDQILRGDDEADEIDWQPHVTINANVLVFNHGCFPSAVAYLPENRSSIFWDLGFLQDRFARASDAVDRASNFLRHLKGIAYSHGLVDKLHLRGRLPRLCLMGMLTC